MKRPIKLQFQLLIPLVTFALAIIFTLWLFQIVLLQPLYEHNKISILKDVANDVEKVVDQSQLESYISSVSERNDLCVRVISEEDVTTSNSGCMIDRLPYNKVYEYYELAVANGGSYLSKSDLIEMRFTPTAPESFISKNSGDKNVIYTKVAHGASNNEFVIIVNTKITKVNAATQTLSDQLLLIGCMILFGTLVLVLFLTKKIVNPIEKIANASKSLANGNYDEVDMQKGYLEVHELNQILSDASVQIQKADKAKRDLIANVSHDLRTPLTMITGYGEMMIDLPDEKNDENIKVIINESKRLNLIVNDLLDLSKLNENKIDIQLSDVNITQCIRHVIKTVEQFTKQEFITINFESKEDLWICADERRITQVLHNFVNNAINHIGENKQINIYQKVKDGNVRIEVQDFGEGIETDKLSLIWDRYYKIEHEHVRATQGSGIGLAIVKEILDLHHYQYGVNSKVNEGSTFYFETKIVKKEN